MRNAELKLADTIQLDDTKPGDKAFTSLFESAVGWVTKYSDDTKTDLISSILEYSKETISYINTNEKDEFVSHIVNEINNYTLKQDGKEKLVRYSPRIMRI